MKSVLISALFLFLLSEVYAQASVPDTMPVNPRSFPCIFYIDGIQVRNPRCDSTNTITTEEIKIIIGGLPVIYGDLKSSIIQIIPPQPAVKPKTRNKK
jgi:hypothetical protein